MKDTLELLNFSNASVAVVKDAEERKQEALQVAEDITEVADDFDNQCAVEAVQSIKSLTNEVEACRKKVKAPVLELGRNIDAAAKGFNKDLVNEVARIQKMVTRYADHQRKLAWEAEKAKQAEQARLERERLAAAEKLKQAETPQEVDKAKQTVEKAVKAEADNKAVTTKPEKVAGLVVQQVKDFKIVDIMETLKARPDLVHVMPNRQAILESIRKSDDQIPGLEVFTTTKTSIRK